MAVSDIKISSLLHTCRVGSQPDDFILHGNVYGGHGINWGDDKGMQRRFCSNCGAKLPGTLPVECRGVLAFPEADR